MRKMLRGTRCIAGKDANLPQRTRISDLKMGLQSRASKPSIRAIYVL